MHGELKMLGISISERTVSIIPTIQLIAPQSPGQNGYAERLMASIREECLNHFIIPNNRQLKKTLASYFLRLPITPKDRVRLTDLTCSYERILRSVPTRAGNHPMAFWPFLIRPIARLLYS